MKVNIVKIGSDSISEKNICKLLTDIKYIENKTGDKFIIISSGSVKLGIDKILKVDVKLSKSDILEIFTKPALSSIGQKELMVLYSKYIPKKGVAQVLIDDYASERDLSNTIYNLLSNNIQIIINHNDALHRGEVLNLSDKTDNDMNSVFLSKLLNIHLKSKVLIDKVIFLTNTNGLLDNNSETVLGGKIDSEYSKVKYRRFVKIDKSNSGTGGMLSKINCSFDCLSFGVRYSILSNSSGGLSFIINNDETNITKFYH